MFNDPPYSRITDTIYLGNVLGLTSEVIHNVEQVISLVPNQHKEKLEEKGIHVFEIPFGDSLDEDIIHYAEKVYNILNNGQKTFIHCTAGRSRSVSCVIYYLMKKHNIDFKKAYSFVEKKRPTIDLNLGFYVQLEKVEFVC